MTAPVDTLKHELATLTKEQTELQTWITTKSKRLDEVDERIRDLIWQIKHESSTEFKATETEFGRETALVIFEGMDTDDYMECGCTRYLDLTEIADTIRAVQIQHSNAQLTKLKMLYQLESYPPRNIYQYTYELSNGDTLICGERERSKSRNSNASKRRELHQRKVEE